MTTCGPSTLYELAILRCASLCMHLALRALSIYDQSEQTDEVNVDIAFSYVEPSTMSLPADNNLVPRLKTGGS